MCTMCDTPKEESLYVHHCCLYLCGQPSIRRNACHSSGEVKFIFLSCYLVIQDLSHESKINSVGRGRNAAFSKK